MMNPFFIAITISSSVSLTSSFHRRRLAITTDPEHAQSVDHFVRSIFPTAESSLDVHPTSLSYRDLLAIDDREGLASPSVQQDNTSLIASSSSSSSSRRVSLAPQRERPTSDDVTSVCASSSSSLDHHFSTESSLSAQRKYIIPVEDMDTVRLFREIKRRGEECGA